MVSQPNRLLQRLTTMSFINKIWDLIMQSPHQINDRGEDPSIFNSKISNPLTSSDFFYQMVEQQMQLCAKRCRRLPTFTQFEISTHMQQCSQHADSYRFLQSKLIRISITFPMNFFNLNYNFSNLLDMRNLQEQGKLF